MLNELEYAKTLLERVQYYFDHVCSGGTAVSLNDDIRYFLTNATETMREDTENGIV